MHSHETWKKHALSLKENNDSHHKQCAICGKHTIEWQSQGALDGEEKWVNAIGDLLEACDTAIPEPERDVDKPFLMCIEDVFSIEGRGTVVTGRVERGIINKMDEVEIVGLRDVQKTTATDLEMFRKLLSEARAGENVGVLLRGTKQRFSSFGYRR